MIFKPFQNDFLDPFQNDAEAFEILMMISIKVLFGEKTKGWSEIPNVWWVRNKHH